MRPVAAAGAYGLLVALVLGYFLLGIPVQFSDSFGNMLKLSAPWQDVVGAEFRQQAFLRPMLWAGLKGVYDLSGGNYFAWFRGVHVVQVVGLVLLYLALVRPRTWTDAAVVPFGLAVLVAMPTFAGTIVEAFPVNTYMSVLLFCFAAALLALARYRWWNDVLAVALFALAALSVETGLLVWVIFVGAALVGARGVSRTGLAALVVLLAGYFALRFGVLGVGAPGLVERSSGFGFSLLDPAELQARFGANPLPFYLYNIATSILSVLSGEPTAGVFRVTDAALRGALTPGAVISLIASVSVTALIVACAWQRRAAWRARTFDRDDRLVLLFGMVLIANAVISYPYTKDVIMSPAGAFMAVAVFVAVRHFATRLPDQLPPGRRLASAATFAIIGAVWAVQYLGIHSTLRRMAHATRIEWAYAEGTLDGGSARLSEADRALFRRLHDDAVYVHQAPPALRLPLLRLVSDE